MSDPLHNELQRLEGREPAAEPCDGTLTVSILFEAADDPADVLRRAREVLLALDRQAIRGWTSFEEWSRILPGWFVGACAPEMTAQEQSDYLAKWRAMDDEARAAIEATSRWALGDWLYWMEPKQRAWWWRADDGRRSAVVVEVEDWPFASGALSWLLPACGATRVRAESG